MLEVLPPLLRLRTLLLGNNRVSKVEDGWTEMCPGLENLVLTNNRLSRFEEIEKLAFCKSLVRLTLIGNIVTNLPNYRLFVVFKMPSLRVLDFQKVTQAERKEA